MKEFSECSENAFRELVKRYKTRLFNFILKGFIKDKDMSDEIVQNTLIKVYEHKFKYKATHQFSTWIYTVCRNLALNELKRKKHIRIDDTDEDKPAFDLPSPENFLMDMEKEELRKIVLSIIEDLKPNYREIIIMRYIEELSYEEIAKVTGKNVNTLKSLTKRGLEVIREKLERMKLHE